MHNVRLDNFFYLTYNGIKKLVIYDGSHSRLRYFKYLRNKSHAFLTSYNYFSSVKDEGKIKY